MDTELYDTQDHFSIDEDDDCSKGSDGMLLDSNDDIFPEVDVDSCAVDKLDKVSANELDNATFPEVDAQSCAMDEFIKVAANELEKAIFPEVDVVSCTVDELDKGATNELDNTIFPEVDVESCAVGELVKAAANELNKATFPEVDVVCCTVITVDELDKGATNELDDAFTEEVDVESCTMDELDKGATNELDKGATNELDKGATNELDELDNATLTEVAVESCTVDEFDKAAANEPDKAAANELDKAAANELDKGAANEFDKAAANELDKGAANELDKAAANKLAKGTANELDEAATNQLDEAAANGLDKAAANELDNAAASELDNPIDDVVVPKVGMVFATVEDAYEFYNQYARIVGFSVRKQRTNKSRSDPSKIQLQSLCCSCEGFYTMVKPPKKKRKEKRFGCKAMFEICLIGDKNYMLTKFVAEHNHDLVPHKNSHLLRSQRKSKLSTAGVINKVQSSILQESDIFSHVFVEANGPQSLTSDCNNVGEILCEEYIKVSDAQWLLDYFKQKKRENKHFIYSFRTDEDYKIRGVFFCDAKSRHDYGLFGDAVCFDTTFKTKDYLVCVLIFGVNSHMQTTLFGCGMLNSETTNAFLWLFTAFMEAMGRKKPNTIFTNQSATIVNAISTIFPETHQKPYPWYIYQNAAKQFSQVAVEVRPLIQRLKECIYNPEAVEEFEKSWGLLLEEYGLGENELLQRLYESRQTWAQVYSDGHFCAGMTTSQRNEGVYKFFRTFFGSNLTLREFVDQYAKTMANRREKEKEAENETQQKFPMLLSNWSIEREAANKYTNKMFYAFQGAYRLTLDQRLQLESQDGVIRMYRVTEMEGQRRSHVLSYNQSESSVLCTCRKFEFHGVQCSHALKLFRDLEFTSLPTQYYLKRWTKRATDEVIYDSYGEAILGDIDPLSTARYNKLLRIAQRIVAKGAKSTDIYSLAKSGMLDLEAKMEAFSISEDEQRRASQKKISGISDDSASNSDEDALLRNTKMKRCRGEPESKVKSSLEDKAQKKCTPSTEMSGKEGNATMPQMIEGVANMYQHTQELFGLAPYPSRAPPWYLPYNFMGCPDPRYRPIFPRLPIDPKAPSSKTNVPLRPVEKLNIPHPPSSFPGSSA